MTDSLATNPQEQSRQALAKRSAWMSVLLRWHWISSALSLIGMLFFAVTGVTLVHAGFFENTTPVMQRHVATLPAPLLLQLGQAEQNAAPDLPADLQTWVREQWGLSMAPKLIEWSSDEVFVDLKRPGVDASLSIDRHNGDITYEAADRGWVAWLNELHKGRNAGPVWNGFLTVFALCCVVFSLTGLLILQMHARSRWLVWPLTALGLLVPAVLILLFVH